MTRLNNISASDSSDETSSSSCTHQPGCCCTSCKLKGVNLTTGDKRKPLTQKESGTTIRVTPPTLTLDLADSSNKLGEASDSEADVDDQRGKISINVPQKVRRSSTVALNSKEIKSLSMALGSDKHEIATIRDSRTGRRFSAMIDSTTGNPISFLGTKDGKRLSLHPITRSSIAELFDYPVTQATSFARRASYATASEVQPAKQPPTPRLSVQPLLQPTRSYKSKSLISIPPITLPRMSIGPLKMSRRVTKTDYKALKQRGDKVRMSDYRVINRSFAYVIIIIVASIITFASLQETISVWIYFGVLAISILLIILSICYLKFHFVMKAKRFQRQYVRHRRATIVSQNLAQNANQKFSLPIEKVYEELKGKERQSLEAENLITGENSV